MVWKFTQFGKIPELKDPILIEGMPGIGNVGKVAADFIIEQLKAVKIYDVFCYKFPHSVFVNENNLIELPTIEIYYKRFTEKELEDVSKQSAIKRLKQQLLSDANYIG